MEIFDLYDENRIKTVKSMIRGDKTPDGFYRMVVHICIFNSDSKMLVQQRQPFKKGWSNMWDVSVGGSAVSGDTSLSAAIREVREELGIVLEPSQLRHFITIVDKSVFDDWYAVNQDIDISELKLQPEEVQNAKWADIDEIKAMIDKEIFIPYHKSFIDMLFHFSHSSGTRTKGDVS
ncbi:MAG: NUDIX domain-containing protein [Oscillospiraceae bacterium]